MKLNINNFSIFIIFFLTIASCQLVKMPQKEIEIIGKWKENWGAGSATNVSYSDEYVITTATNGSISIVCPSRKNYVFSKITYTNKNLKIKLLIKDLKYNSEDAWVEYDLTLQDNNTLKGKALTKAGKVVNIIWDRIIPNQS
jgi:hypothetical protein